MKRNKTRRKTPLDSAWASLKKDLLVEIKKKEQNGYSLSFGEYSKDEMYIFFDFKKIHKHNIYMILAKLSYKDYVRRNLKKLCLLLVGCSNLGVNEDDNVNTETIYRKIYQFKAVIEE